ncbi:hypothetical protein [Sorangium sp. So ce1097]|uniref:hypothetical protein n=1 Tax=Sorangium sp. So ce1097 TaxID=3133330 RepID=UPI003F61CC67
MSRRTTSLAVASLAAASFMLGSATASAKDHTDWALDFIDRAVTNEATTGDEKCYMTWGDSEVVNIDGTDVEISPWTGRTKGACFFVLSLKKAMGYSDKDIRYLWIKSRPSSGELFDFINDSPAVGAPAREPENYFRRVTTAVDIQKGDVLVIDKTATYAGHTVIITGPAREILPQINPRYSGTRQYAVPIVDSTSTAHGCFSEESPYADSRWSGECTGGYMAEGAGTATMRVYADSFSGMLLGYTWSVTSSQTSYYSPSTRPYRIGRLAKLPEPQGDDLPPPPP